MILSQYPAPAMPKSFLHSFVIRNTLIFACSAQSGVSNHILCSTNYYRDILDEGYMQPVEGSGSADMPVSLSDCTFHVKELHSLQPWYHSISATIAAGTLTHEISFLRSGRNASFRGCLWVCWANAVIKTA